MTVNVLENLAEFQKVIESGKPVVIDFWATWCGPCRVISPIFEKLSDLSEFSGVEFYKVDVDTATDISEEVGIRAMPTFILFKDSDKKGDLVGANPAKLTELLKQAQSLL